MLRHGRLADLNPFTQGGSVHGAIRQLLKNGTARGISQRPENIILCHDNT
ncbi:ArsR family transcriptional regulator [Agrobacterium sp. ATCC 31749]|nr:ArsR family transcriptional regulator [Agrobacterium sp. ATCC 31749]